MASIKKIIQGDNGEVMVEISTAGFNIFSFFIDFRLIQVFVAALDSRNPSETNSVIAVYNSSAALSHLLVAPIGWPEPNFQGVTVDDQGNVYATSQTYNAIVQWTGAARPRTASSARVEFEWITNPMKSLSIPESQSSQVASQ